MPKVCMWLLQMLLPGKNKDASRLIDWVEHGESILIPGSLSPHLQLRLIVVSKASAYQSARPDNIIMLCMCRAA